jgi:glutathione synthase
MRVPRKDEARANIHVGGVVERAAVDAKDRAICAALAPALRRDGLAFVGIDVIGGKLTEVNVTSPTGVQEIARLEGLAEGRTPQARVVDWVEKRARAGAKARPKKSRRPRSRR